MPGRVGTCEGVAEATLVAPRESEVECPMILGGYVRGREPADTPVWTYSARLRAHVAGLTNVRPRSLQVPRGHLHYKGKDT